MILLILGAVVALVGIALTAGGSTLVWAHATQRDRDGFYTTKTERFDTPTYALTSRIDLGEVPGEHDWVPAHPVGTVRVRASGNGEHPVFAGIARQTDVDRWLTGVAHERVTGADFGPFKSDTETVAGTRAATSPLDQGFWAASVSGSAEQTLLWPSQSGQWTIVVMNADAQPGVAVDVGVGARTGVLLPIGIGVGGFGLLLLCG